jgi:hypothetical protein
MHELDIKNIIDIKNILENKTIFEFWQSGFKDFDLLKRSKLHYFSLYTKDFSNIQYCCWDNDRNIYIETILNNEKAIRR